MAIQKKHGKGRLDKWYKLAKEKGYRARAAFKLIQLNKKYGFLEKSKVLLDLCAAPGSWCQVAAEVMPTQSIIVGVDLAPIKPIPRAITFQSDITSDKCRATIRQHLKTWKADTVLHDGAPNVGVAWVQDAYSQAELVLQALKLATNFLIEGGTFVTKVFRSKDYNALMWVFKKLFTNVEATKPPSSRNVSAEIFVVCRGFKAPKHMDPKFLDPRHVFADVEEATPNNEAKVFNPEKKKRKREGYEEGEYTQHKETSATEFIHTTDPIAILGSVNTLSFEQGPNGDLALATLERLPETTEEIRTCCSDLKVLGRKEFRNLLRWRLKVREKFGLSAKNKKQEPEEGEEVAEVESMDEEMKIQEELQRLRDQESSKKKKERRKENERKQKELVRLQMHMTTPHDIGLEQEGPNGDGAMFNLKSADKAESITKVASGKMDVADEESETSEDSESDLDSNEDGDRLDRELDTLYENYQQRKEDNDAKQRAKRARKQKETDDFKGFSGSEAEDASDNDADAEMVLPLRPATAAEALSNRASMFFDQDIFQDLGIADVVGDDDSAIEMNDEEDDRKNEALAHEHENSIKEKPNVAINTSKATHASVESASASSFNKPAKDTKQTKNAQNPSSNGDDSKIEQVTASENDDPRTKNGQLDIDIITAEAMALAQSIATGEKTSADLTDDGFNKYAFRDVDGLPDWFLDDEGKHSKPQRPITAAAASAIREKLRALNARPIKKVREARSRKKFKAAQKLERLRKKSALLLDEEGMTEKDKASTIAKLMSKAGKKKPKPKVKLVVATGGNRGISGRPRGVKGKYKIVDRRLKKDVRAEKRLAKKKK
ncbi:AdoMet-dependent rRNA methyltransferase spb1 [Endocarpon pusillum Z07020]|uniref:AdoMet-dependent rRNA methyltransferase spb1 n=1 Tax=Endocarpon pusillum (strain Z07020 / HMAS-L-300199) TaxID=1263415 RepID=U1GLW7_ENDPU|nr:AdoMet-dependent rRNA methyltransferase spb1 [Endocarpon pusillum Z07020]ERF72901.1 AdoMet-dependent rRNA methyltransferase spb1 [Endocarpon pusillum Z07020]